MGGEFSSCFTQRSKTYRETLNFSDPVIVVLRRPLVWVMYINVCVYCFMLTDRASTILLYPVLYAIANPVVVCSNKEVQKSTGHIMVTARYSNQQGSKSLQILVGPTTREHRKLMGVKTISLGTNYSSHCLTCCQYFKTGATSYTEDCLVFCPSTKVIKRDAELSEGYTQRQVMRHFTSNGTDQLQNGSPNLLTPYREQTRLTRIAVAYPRSALSVTKRRNNAPISFDQHAQVSEGRTLCRSKGN